MYVRNEISEAEYSELRSLKYKALRERVERTLPPEWILGYGYYGSRLEKNGGKYYIVHNIGDTCD